MTVQYCDLISGLVAFSKNSNDFTLRHVCRCAYRCVNRHKCLAADGTRIRIQGYRLTIFGCLSFHFRKVLHEAVLKIICRQHTRVCVRALVAARQKNDPRFRNLPCDRRADRIRVRSKPLFHQLSGRPSKWRRCHWFPVPHLFRRLHSWDGQSCFSPQVHRVLSFRCRCSPSREHVPRAREKKEPRLECPSRSLVVSPELLGFVEVVVRVV